MFILGCALTADEEVFLIVVMSIVCFNEPHIIFEVRSIMIELMHDILSRERVVDGNGHDQ